MSSEYDLTPEQEAKAPKWLLSKFTAMRQELRRLQRTVDIMSGSKSPDLISAGITLFPTGNQDGNDSIHLPSCARIRFAVGGVIGEDVDVARPYFFAGKRHDDLGIEIQASGRIAQVPGASNVEVISTIEGMTRILNRRSL